MSFKNIKFWFIVTLLLSFTTQIGLTRAQDAPTPEATEVIAPCSAPPEVTPEATLTAELIPEVTAVPTQDAPAPLLFESFLPTDVTFNPDANHPVVVIMIFSLIFQNQLDQSLELSSPHFQLAIEGVPWGEVASTDFQMGQLLANATQGIVLQSLTFVSKTTDEQKAVLDCIRDGKSVNLTLTGTIDSAIDGAEQTIQVEMTSPDVIIQARKPQS